MFCVLFIYLFREVYIELPTLQSLSMAPKRRSTPIPSTPSATQQRRFSVPNPFRDRPSTLVEGITKRPPLYPQGAYSVGGSSSIRVPPTKASDRDAYTRPVATYREREPSENLGPEYDVSIFSPTLATSSSQARSKPPPAPAIPISQPPPAPAIPISQPPVAPAQPPHTLRIVPDAPSASQLFDESVSVGPLPVARPRSLSAESFSRSQTQPPSPTDSAPNPESRSPSPDVFSRSPPTSPLAPTSDDDLPFDFPYLDEQGEGRYYCELVPGGFSSLYYGGPLVRCQWTEEQRDRMSRTKVANLEAKKWVDIPEGWLAPTPASEDDILADYQGMKDEQERRERVEVEEQRYLAEETAAREAEEAERAKEAKKAKEAKEAKEVEDEDEPEDMLILESDPSGSDYSSDRHKRHALKRLKHRDPSEQAESDSDKSSLGDEDVTAPARRKSGTQRRTSMHKEKTGTMPKGKGKAHDRDEDDDEDDEDEDEDDNDEEDDEEEDEEDEVDNTEKGKAKGSSRRRKGGRYSKAQLEEIHNFGNEISGRIDFFAKSMKMSTPTLLRLSGLRLTRSRADNPANLFKKVFALDYKKPKRGAGTFSYLLLSCLLY